MAGLKTTSKHKGLNSLTAMKCCRQKSQVENWGQCYNHGAWSSLDREGWTRCNAGYFMAGLLDTFEYLLTCN